MRLKSVDLPTFGRPTIAMIGEDIVAALVELCTVWFKISPLTGTFGWIEYAESPESIL
jgi:hypothetical protein